MSATTRLAGVTGAPIAQSLSPVLHNAWIEAAGLDAVYVAFRVRPERFAVFIQGLRAGPVVGLNVTAPFKRQAFTLADEASPAASRSGAANLLLFLADGRVAADNTDGEGLLAAFACQAPGSDLGAGPAVVIGAGGAARGAAAALLDAGVPEVRVLARSTEAAICLAEDLGPAARGGGLSGDPALLAEAAILINATPPGALSPVWIGEALGAVGGQPTVMDMVYRPVRTPLLLAAAARGWPVVDGLAMLIGQAAPSFARLFGIAPPEVPVRELALAALEAGAG